MEVQCTDQRFEIVDAKSREALARAYIGSQGSSEQSPTEPQTIPTTLLNEIAGNDTTAEAVSLAVTLLDKQTRFDPEDIPRLCGEFTFRFQTLLAHITDEMCFGGTQKTILTGGDGFFNGSFLTRLMQNLGAQPGIMPHIQLFHTELVTVLSGQTVRMGQGLLTSDGERLWLELEAAN